jgi:uncharacterized protein (TIGR01777 family)
VRILLTGATGFVGRALVSALLAEGHSLVVWTRSPGRARDGLGADVDVLPAGDGDQALATELGRSDAVVNLAGAPIIGARWTSARKATLIRSRVDLTTRVVAACRTATRPPRVLVSASAVGVYGPRGDEVLTEASAPGTGFLASLATRWEAAAAAAADLGMRVVHLRTAIVLGRAGGALAPQLPLFRLGLGGPFGSGRQYVPWIHLRDVVGIIVTALGDQRLAGPVNVAAPNETTSREFARALGRAVGRPAVLPVPALALRVALGEAADALLDSQRVRPARLGQLGFRFAFPTLDAALADIVATPGVRIAPLRAASGGNGAGDDYLRRRPARFELTSETTIDAPLDQTFRFFSDARNLGLLTPPAMGLRIDGTPPAMAEGACIDYRIRVGPVPSLAWRTRIVKWEPGRCFVDVQERGPYASWWHEHAFEADGARTRVRDRVCYAPPLPSLLGALVNRVVVAPMLRRIFGYRGEVIRLRFARRS